MKELDALIPLREMEPVSLTHLNACMAALKAMVDYFENPEGQEDCDDPAFIMQELQKALSENTKGTA